MYSKNNGAGKRNSRNTATVFTSMDNKNKILSSQNLSLFEGENGETGDREKKRRIASAYGSRANGVKSQSTSFTDFQNRESNMAWQENGQKLSCKVNSKLSNKIAETIMVSIFKEKKFINLSLLVIKTCSWNRFGLERFPF